MGRIEGRPSARSYDRWAKRALDLTLLAAVLPALLPVLAGIALLVWAALGRPVFFRQERPGRGGKPFQLVKLRTMRESIGEDLRPLPDDQRMTRLGAFLRRTSLDELPEVWNILKGEMSWVGPRPLLMKYLPIYTPRQARRHDVLPGLTGWAQVKGRNALTWPEKFEYDTAYVQRRSVSMDLLIIVMSVGFVIRGTGVSQRGRATTDEFLGS